MRLFQKNHLVMVIVFLLCSVLAGCDGDRDGGASGTTTEGQPQDQAYNISGTWTGSVSGYGYTVDITINITQTDSSVTGDYLLQSNGETETGSITGTYTGGTGTLTFIHEGEPVIDGVFAFSGDSADGTFTYESYTLTIDLTRN